jgi:hypothetical protein
MPKASPLARMLSRAFQHNRFAARRYARMRRDALQRIDPIMCAEFERFLAWAAP